MKTEVVGVRLALEQKTILEKAASEKGITIQELLRTSAINAIGEQALQNDLSDTDREYVTIYLPLTGELDRKIGDMATELGITKQQCIRRLINEGNIYDMRINIDMAEEFLELASEIRNMNRLLNGIYTVCKRVDGILTKHEVEHLYEVIHEINENTSGMRASIFKTNGQLKEMASKRLEKLIKDSKMGG